MKVLVLHPADDPFHGPWTGQQWDAMFDLGTAGRETYQRWSESLGCPVQSAERIGTAEFEQIRAFLGSGLGRIVDQHGLDWWDLISLEFHPQLEQWAKLQKLAAALGKRDDLFVSRAGFESRALRVLVGDSVRSFSSGYFLSSRLRHYARLLSTFSFSQLVQILGDKYDTGYRLRTLLATHHRPCARPVILLPSAYINVSRTELQYAEMLPERHFLLMATRQSGWVSSVPDNVTVRKLASYAHRDSGEDEFEDLLRRWNKLKSELTHSELFGSLVGLGVFDGFTKFLRAGLLIRDAWLRVFEREPVQAVLCADDANLPTRIPLKIAVNRGLPAVSCHHGALDGRYRMRPRHDVLFLAKGGMEQDYLHSVCGSPRSAIEIGAPVNKVPRRDFSRNGGIVFFSEPYEILGGRTSEFYRDVLPRLAEVADATHRNLTIKLHPSESLRERTLLARGVVPGGQYKRLRFIAGPLTEELLNNTWAAVTVVSTTAMECTLRGTPAFLCAWLDYSPYGYLDQMVKFGAGARLRSPEDILEIPEQIEAMTRPPTCGLWQPIGAEGLERLLAGEFQRVAAAV